MFVCDKCFKTDQNLNPIVLHVSYTSIVKTFIQFCGQTYFLPTPNTNYFLLPRSNCMYKNAFTDMCPKYEIRVPNMYRKT